MALARERVDELRGFTPEAAAAAQLEADAWAEVGPDEPVALKLMLGPVALALVPALALISNS